MAGLVSDYTGGRATTCGVMLLAAAPMVSIIPSIQLLTVCRKVFAFVWLSSNHLQKHLM